MTSLSPITGVSGDQRGGECAYSDRERRLLRVLDNEEQVIWRTYGPRREENNFLPPPLKRGNSIDYEDLTGFELPGLKVTSHKKVSPSRLGAERTMRAAACGAGSVLSVGATLGLFYSGFKTLTAVLRGSDQEEANNASAKSFALTAAAGVGTALAQENVNWGAGALGMGLMGKYLDTPIGLAAFSIFDGLNAIGMGQVKLRDNKNINGTSKNSIFNNTNLSFLKPLKPFLEIHEYSIRKFWNTFTSARGLKNTLSLEPYDLYCAAGGGLLSGGALLGAASAFSGFMGEKAKSLLYIPYSLTSLVNLVALGRDGNVIKKRADKYNDMKPIENKSTKIEGWAKMIASPVIALNYLLLGLKGVGVNFLGDSENVAKSLRQFGVGIAYVGFAAQSGVKFLIPDHWGPKIKNVFDVVLNPKEVVNYLMGIVSKVSERETRIARADYKGTSDFFYPILQKDEHCDLYEELINTPFFQNLKTRHLTGLPNEMALDRAALDRFTHSIRVGALACIHADRIRENNPDYSYLYNDPAFSLSMKLASLLHDTGHSKLPRCHLSETTYPMAKDANDHFSIESLDKNSNSGFYDIILSYCRKLYGQNGDEIAERVIKNIKNILGHKPMQVKTNDSDAGVSREEEFMWSYKPATDAADYMRSKGSDFPSSFGVEHWGEDQYKHFADQRVIFRDKMNRLRVGYSEEGAIDAFKQLYLRLIFNAFLNSHPVTLSTEAAYKYGARHVVPEMTLDRLSTLSDRELDELAVKFVGHSDDDPTQVNRNVFGGSKAYAGYGPKDTIYVVNNGKVTEFLDYYETVIKTECPDIYEKMKYMVDVLTNPSMVELRLKFDPSYSSANRLSQPLVSPASSDSPPQNRELAYALATARSSGA